MLVIDKQRLLEIIREEAEKLQEVKIPTSWTTGRTRTKKEPSAEELKDIFGSAARPAKTAVMQKAPKTTPIRKALARLGYKPWGAGPEAFTGPHASVTGGSQAPLAGFGDVEAVKDPAIGKALWPLIQAARSGLPIEEKDRIIDTFAKKVKTDHPDIYRALERQIQVIRDLVHQK